MSINFNKAYYIKLGREGCWEESSIASGLLRLGWDEQDISDINLKRWSVVESQSNATYLVSVSPDSDLYCNHN